MKKDLFFERHEHLGEMLSYNDVLLLPDFSDFLPGEADLTSRFSRNISLKCPIVSSPMDTVTESEMAIAMAKLGGLGIIHKGLSSKEQASEVARVKFDIHGFLKEPKFVLETSTLGEVKRRIREKHYKFDSFPILSSEGKLVGLLTHKNFKFSDKDDDQKPVSELMTALADLLTIENEQPIDEVYRSMKTNGIGILPVLNPDGTLGGIYVWSDVKRNAKKDEVESQLYSLDASGSLLVGAAIGVGDEALERAELLVRKGVDVLVVDTAHGDSRRVHETVKELKRRYGSVDIVVGNIARGDAAKRLADIGADGVRVGMGPGSICTTRVVSGMGVPQISAIYGCAKALDGSGVPVCGDGGIKFSGDITKAIGAGADTVMLGGMLAGSDEAPGEVFTHEGKLVKGYRGMGSLGAMQQNRASKERYGQDGVKDEKLVPEGVEGVVPYKGPVSKIIIQCAGGLRAGMGYIGTSTIARLQEKAEFVKISAAGLAESLSHGVLITKEAPNYGK